MAAYFIGFYAATFLAVKTYNKLNPKENVITFSSKEEEDYVNRYIQHEMEQEKKPELLRVPFKGRINP